MTYDQRTNGQQIEATVGKEFDVSLPEARTAGYQWTLRKSGAAKCAVISESEQPAASVGGSGTHTWHFRATKTGDCTLALDYKRSWQENTGPERTYTLKVHVQP
jgi:predicted secreted protein